MSLEVQALSDRVQDLVEAVEALAPPVPVSEAPASDHKPARGEVVVGVSPLPELAMAAVAETTLRGLDSVRKVVSVERSDSQATFVLEVGERGDLVSEMRSAMPVPIDVEAAPDGSLKVALKWAWGRSAAG